MDTLRDPGQHHEDAIDQLVEHLFRRCFDRFDEDMDKAIQAVIESFRRYRTQQQAYEYPEDLLLDDGRTRNFLVAQQAALLLFANRVAILADKEDFAAARSLVDGLWKEIQKIYLLFFQESPPGEHSKS